MANTGDKPSQVALNDEIEKTKLTFRSELIEIIRYRVN